MVGPPRAACVWLTCSCHAVNSDYVPCGDGGRHRVCGDLGEHPGDWHVCSRLQAERGDQPDAHLQRHRHVVRHQQSLHPYVEPDTPHGRPPFDTRRMRSRAASAPDMRAQCWWLDMQRSPALAHRSATRHSRQRRPARLPTLSRAPATSTITPRLARRTSAATSTATGAPSKTLASVSSGLRHGRRSGIRVGPVFHRSPLLGVLFSQCHRRSDYVPRRDGAGEQRDVPQDQRRQHQRGGHLRHGLLGRAHTHLRQYGDVPRNVDDGLQQRRLHTYARGSTGKGCARHFAHICVLPTLCSRRSD